MSIIVSVALIYLLLNFFISDDGEGVNDEKR